LTLKFLLAVEGNLAQRKEARDLDLSA
jgi:hypothetical protein